MSRVASRIYALLSVIRQQMSPFDPFRGGGLPKGDNVPFFYRFFCRIASLMHNTCLYCTQIALGSHPQPYIRRLQSLAPHSTAHRGTESRVVDLATEYRGVISPVDILHFSLGLYSTEYQRTTLRSFNGSSPQMSVEEDDLQQFHGPSPPLSMQCAAMRLLGRQLRHEGTITCGRRLLCSSAPPLPALPAPAPHCLGWPAPI